MVLLELKVQLQLPSIKIPVSRSRYLDVPCAEGSFQDLRRLPNCSGPSLTGLAKRDGFFVKQSLFCSQGRIHKAIKVLKLHMSVLNSIHNHFSRTSGETGTGECHPNLLLQRCGWLPKYGTDPRELL